MPNEALFHAEWLLDHPGGSLLFGQPRHDIWNRRTPEFDSDVRANDVDRPRADGRGFGIDYAGGQTVSFDLMIRGVTRLHTRELAESARALWRHPAVREEAGVTAELRMSYEGRTRSVFGRPRRWAADYSDASINGLVPVLADFACADDLFYGLEESATMTTAASGGSGWVTPFVFPLTSTRASDHSQFVRITGDSATWPITTIRGPIGNPKVRIGDRLHDLRLTLAYDDSVVIDTRPWVRSVTRNGVSVAGALRGTRLGAMSLTPGQHEVTITGVDPTGTASVTLAWRPAYAAP